ncbi:MAG: hypothetical protein KKI09_15715 [Spirochaetes bacterium]|nr:hypothetical protein [Spirochaetota bacterium]MBU0956869.1 hypothetical protein [Spirochaetota bacterium]
MSATILGSPRLRSHEPQLKLYDFRRPDKFSHEQLRTLHLLHQDMARQLGLSLSSRLRLPCEAEVTFYDQLTYEEFMRMLDVSETLAVMELKPLKGQMLLHLNRRQTAVLLDRSYGSPAPDGIPAADLHSDLDVVTLEFHLDEIKKVVASAWQPLGVEEARLHSVESDPRYCQIVQPVEMIVMITLQLQLGGVKGECHLVYPFLQLEPLLSRLSARYWYHPQNTQVQPAALAAAARCPLAAQVVVDSGVFSVAELHGLQVGSELPLPALDRGEAMLRCGGAEFAELENIKISKDACSATFVPAGQAENSLFGLEPDSEEEPNLAGLSREIRTALAEIKGGLESTVSGFTSAIAEIKGRQEAMDDRLAYGQADFESQPEGVHGQRPFASLAAYDVGSLSLFLTKERNQLLALVLSYMEDAAAGALLETLAEERQLDIVQRLHRLDRTEPGLLRLLERVLMVRLQSAGQQVAASGGIARIAGMLNHVSRASEARIIGTLDQTNPELAEEIKRNMFVFEDITMLEDESIAAVLERADLQDILVAMKPVVEAVRERIFACFPAELQARMREAYTQLGRVRLRDCDAAGLRVVEVIKQLEGEGRIFISRADEPEL